MNDPVEFLALNATIKAVESANPNGEFEVILSTDAVDRDGESVQPNAFNPLPKKIPIFVDHDWRKGAQPVAKAVPFYDVDGTLKAKGVYASTARAQEIRSLVNDEILDSMSVGFLNGKRETINGQKSVVSGSLFESSFTAIPVNTEAAVLASKALADADEKAGARNSKSDAEKIQAVHDHATALGATCGTKAVTKSIEGSVEALQDRVRDALEDAYGEWACWLRGVLPDSIVFDRNGDTFRQTYTDDGAVVTLTGAPVEVDIHEVITPDADAATEPADEATLLSLNGSADNAAAQAAAESADDAAQAMARIRLLAARATA